MKSSLSLSPQRHSVDPPRSRSRSKHLERWFRDTYSPNYLQNQFTSSFESSSLKFSSPSKQMQRSRSSCEASAHRYFQKLADNGSPRYMSPTCSVLKAYSPGDYAVGCSICGCYAIRDACFTHNDSPPRVRPSYQNSFARLRDPDCGAYACIYKKVSKPYDGEETEQIRVRSTRLIEDCSLEKYNTSSIEVIKADPDYEGLELSKIYYREVIPPVKSALTRMNWEDRKMVSETLYHNSVASEYVREEERLRVAVRRAEYSNRIKGIARDMVVTSITGKEDSQDIVKQLAQDLTIENTEEELCNLLTPQRKLSARNSTDRRFTPLKGDQPKEFSLVIKEKNRENEQLGYMRPTQEKEKNLPNRKNRFSREQQSGELTVEELKVPRLRKSPYRSKTRNQSESSPIQTHGIIRPREKRNSDGGSDNSLEIQFGKKPNQTFQSNPERVKIDKDSELNVTPNYEKLSHNLSSFLNETKEGIELFQYPIDRSLEYMELENVRKMASNGLEIKPLPYFYKTAASGSKKGHILKAMRERSAMSDFVNNIKAEVYQTLTTKQGEDDRQNKPTFLNLLEESKQHQFKGAENAKKTDQTVKSRSNSSHKSPGGRKNTKSMGRSPVADSIRRKNLNTDVFGDKKSQFENKRKFNQDSRVKLNAKTKPNLNRAESNNKLCEDIPDIDQSLTLEFTLHSKSSSFPTEQQDQQDQEDRPRDPKSIPNLTSSLSNLGRDEIRPELLLRSIPEFSNSLRQDGLDSELSLDGHITGRFEESPDCLSPGKKSFSEKLSIEDSDIEHDSIRIKKLDEAICTESIKGDEKETMFEISLRSNNSKDLQDKVKGVRKPVSQYFKDIKDTKHTKQDSDRLKVDSVEIEPEASPNRVDTSEDVRRILGSPNGICSEQEVELEASPSRNSIKTTPRSDIASISPVPSSMKHDREKDYGLDLEIEFPRNPVYQTEYRPLMDSPVKHGYSLAIPNTALLRMSSDPVPKATLPSDLNLTKSNSKPEYINAKVTYTALLVNKKPLPKDSYFSQKYDKLLQEINSISASNPLVRLDSDSAESNLSLQTEIRVLSASSDKPDFFTGSSLSSVRGPSEGEEKYLHPLQDTKIFIGTPEESSRFLGSDSLRSITSDLQTEIYYEENESNAFYQVISDQESEIYPINSNREHEDRGMCEYFQRASSISEEIDVVFSSKLPVEPCSDSLEAHDKQQRNITYQLYDSTIPGIDYRTRSDEKLQLKLNPLSEGGDSPTFDRVKRSKINREPFTIRFDDDRYIEESYPDLQMVKTVSITDIEPADLQSFSGSDSNRWMTPREEADIKETKDQLDSYKWMTPKEEADIKEPKDQLDSYRYGKSNKSKAFRFDENESDSYLKESDELSRRDSEMKITQELNLGCFNSPKHDLSRLYNSSPKFSSQDQEPELSLRIRQLPEEPYQTAKEYQSIRSLSSAKTNPSTSLGRNLKASLNSVSEIIQTVDLRPQPLSKDFSRGLRTSNSIKATVLSKPNGISPQPHKATDLSDSYIRTHDNQYILSKVSQDHLNSSNVKELERVKEVRIEITKKLIDKQTGEEMKKTTKTVEKKTVKSQKYSEIIAKYSRGRRTISQDFSFQSLNSSKQESSKYPVRSERYDYKSIEPQDLSSKVDKLLEHFHDERVMKGLKLLGGFVNYLEKDGNLILDISRE